MVAGGAATAWALSSQPYLALAAFLSGLGGAIWALRRMFNYADKYPNHAIMEGGHFVRYTEITQGAKDPQIIENGPLVANTAPPLAITSAGKDE